MFYFPRNHLECIGLPLYLPITHQLSTGFGGQWPARISELCGGESIEVPPVGPDGRVGWWTKKTHRLGGHPMMLVVGEFRIIRENSHPTKSQEFRVFRNYIVIGDHLPQIGWVGW